MLKQTPGIIYIESQRGKVLENGGETYCSFNYKNFINEHKTPILPLQYFNETIIHGGREVLLDASDSFCFILPVYNSLEVITGSQHIDLYPGEALFLENYPEISCINPEKKESASFIWFTVFREIPLITDSLFQKVTLPVNRIKNQWIDLPPDHIHLKIACVDARSELDYFPISNKSKLFLFNINGSFEVNGRLLNQSDGLVLWDCNEVDIEALSPDSIILLLEL